MKGPDTHGAQPRYTLCDNYDSVDHQSSGGSVANLPHHLDGYTRWNNEVDASSTFDLWAPGGYSFAVTQANLIGYKTAGGSSPLDAYVEGFGSRVSPDSLYEAQLKLRLGALPAWVNAAKNKHATLIGNIQGNPQTQLMLLRGSAPRNSCCSDSYSLMIRSFSTNFTTVLTIPTIG